MWTTGLRNRKHKTDTTYGDEDDPDEYSPMIPKNSTYSQVYSNEHNHQYLQNHHTELDIDINNIEVHLDKTDEFNANEEDLNKCDTDLSSMGFIKITSNVYASTCADISVDFLKSIGFETIINIDTAELLLDINDYTHIHITNDTLRKRDIHSYIEGEINKGLLNPKIVINFNDLNMMIVVISFYMLKNRIEGDFMDTYELGGLPYEYIGIVNELIPNIHQFNKENDLIRLYDMFPDVPRDKINELYKKHYGIFEEIIHHLFI